MIVGTPHRPFPGFCIPVLAITLAMGIPVSGFCQMLKPINSAQFIVAPDEKTVLRWKAARPPGKGPIPCTIENYDGALVAKLEAQADGEGVSLPVELARGFYTITFVQQNQIFGVVSTPRPQPERDAFFAIDAALSVLRSVDQRQDLIEVVARIGVASGRERLLWSEIQPSKDTWDWQAKRSFEKTRELYAEAGLGVLELFHDAPSWLLDGKKGDFPKDLPAAARSWRQIAERWGKYWSALEVWNEADIPAGQGGPQAEQYVPIVKAVTYALRSSGSKVLLGGGVFAYLTRPYMDLAAENGLLSTSDFLSFHYYSEPFGLESYVAEYRGYLAEFGHPHMPLWLTECGSPWIGEANTRPSRANDRKTALRFGELAVEARSSGIEQYFPFVLVAYTEHKTKNFGMLDRQGTPVRSLAAYAQAIAALSHGKYIGDIALGEGFRTRVFSKGGDLATLVVMRRDGAEASAAVPFAISDLRGVDGRSLHVSESGPQRIPDGMAYITAKLSDVTPHLDTATRAMELTRLAQAPAAPAQPPSPIILAPSIASADLAASIRGYEVPEKLSAVDIKVRVSNLSSETATVTVKFQTAGSPAASPAAIAPESSIEISQSIPVSDMSFDKEGRAIIRMQGELPDGRSTLPAAIALSRSLGLQESLQTHAYKFALPITDLTRWKNNASGPISISKTPEGNLGYTVQYGSAGEKWAFPQFTVPQEADLDRVTGIVVRGRCKNPATVRVMTWPGEGNSFSTTGYSVFKADGEWHVAHVPLDSFLKPDGVQKLGRQIRLISLGVSAHEGAGNEIEISDLVLVGD